jgi:AcrR family transcriptional regulator
MDLKLSIKLNEKLYLRDPDSTELGRRIVRNGIIMINELGLEAFTFKKLAEEIKTTEASVYRYFENKHRLLQYIVAWYWNYLEYSVIFQINNLSDADLKLRKVIALLVLPPDKALGRGDFDAHALHQIVVNESSKAYFNKEVDASNQVQIFKPYKDLCARIAELILEYNPEYPYPRSLASTLVETAHFQQYFMNHLPRLTDFSTDKKLTNIQSFLEHLIFTAIK